MKELTLQEVKEIELEILKTFDTFCKEHNIRYYLAFGTLLGAIRYKKFIPWDDDVDVLVPREDYDKLLKLYQDSDKYHLFVFEKDEKYAFPFAKLCNMKTKLIETFYPDNGIELGVNIDIFPLDAFDNNLERAKEEVRYINRKGACLGYSKTNKIHTNNPIKYFVWSMIVTYCKIRGSAYFIRKIINKSNNPSQKGSAYVGAKVWCIWGDRCIIPAKAFADTVYVEFEGQMFPAPAGYDTYLTCLYGDYLPEPPKDKQKTHHSFVAYRL